MKKCIRTGKYRVVGILLAVMLSVAGCGIQVETVPGKAEASEAAESVEETTAAESADNTEEPASVEETEAALTADSEASEKSAKASEETKEADAETAQTSEETETETEKIAEEAAPAADPGEDEELPLCKRLCGKYSHEVGGEYETIEITEFGGNLYAFGGDAIGEPEDEDLEIYSFWAMELFPENKDDLLSGELDECKVGVMAFSIMSNFGKYWNAPSAGTIRLTEEGIEFEGFDAAFPFTGGDSGVLFVRDERVADTFPYLNKEAAGGSEGLQPDGLVGFWREKDRDVPVYLECTGDGNLRMYRKDVNHEVRFGCGGYRFYDTTRIEGMMSLLGNGGMPAEIEAVLTLEEDSLTFDTGDSGGELAELFFDRKESAQFERISEDEIPVITLSEVQEAGFDENRSYDAWEETGSRTMYYTIYDRSGMEVLSDKVILHDVQVNIPGSADGETMTLIIDSDTVFDESCETGSFGNYCEGDTPLSWFRHNYEEEDDDTAIAGVFEVSVTEDHIDRYYDSFWWD